MNKRIIYPTENGGAAVIVPADCGQTIEAIARKDVPAGIPYKIVNTSEIPTDRTFRSAWEADMTNPDGVGAESNEFPVKEEA